MNTGPTKIWSLIYETCQNNPHAFLKNWQKLKPLIAIRDLREKPSSGEHAGKSALWLIAKAASEGNLKPLEKIWHEFGNKITLADLRQTAQSSEDRGKSVLWLIVKAIYYNPPSLIYGTAANIFDEIWRRFIQEISITDLRQQPHTGPDAGLSVIGLLAQIMWHKGFSFFIEMWVRFKPLVDMNDLLTPQKERPIDLLLMSAFSKKRPILMDFTFGVNSFHKGFLPLTMELLQTLPGEIPIHSSTVHKLLCNRPSVYNLITARNAFFSELEQASHHHNYCQTTYIHLLNLANLAHDAGYFYPHKILYGLFKNRVTLDHLPSLLPFATAASKGRPEHFLFVLSKFKDKITINTLREGNILKLLALAGPKKSHGPLIIILELLKDQFTIQDFNEKDLLSLLINLHEDHINEKTLEILSQIPGIITDSSLLSDPRIRARNDFCKALEVAQHYAVKKLFELAEVAHQQNYLRSFYDLGEWFLKNQQPHAAIEAFAKVPPSSKKYDQANVFATEECFALALGCKNLASQKAYLRKSSAFALKCAYPDRIAFIEEIAAVYSLRDQDNYLSFTLPTPYPELASANIPEFFSLLDKIKEERQQAFLAEKFKKLTIKSPTLVFSDIHRPSTLSAEVSASRKKKTAKDRL